VAQLATIGVVGVEQGASDMHGGRWTGKKLRRGLGHFQSSKTRFWRYATELAKVVGAKHKGPSQRFGCGNFVTQNYLFTNFYWATMTIKGTFIRENSQFKVVFGRINFK